MTQMAFAYEPPIAHVHKEYPTCPLLQILPVVAPPGSHLTYYPAPRDTPHTREEFADTLGVVGKVQAPHQVNTPPAWLP